MNRSKIEWCDHTWNPITGCRHECPYCYARTMTARFAGDVRLNKMAKKDYLMVSAADGGEDLYVLDSTMLNETGHPLVYPFGFAPTLHRYRMDIPAKLKMGKNIFVGAMADVFGGWVPEEWIKEIIDICRAYPIHNYLFLTKNPERYERIDAAGMLSADENMWYGSTLTKPEDRCFVSNTHNTFWSIEPIHAPFQIWEKDKFSPDWIIIGAETGNRKDRIIPKREWIEDIVSGCDKEGIPVFMKDSLIPIVGQENMRRDFPKQLKHSRISPKIKKKMYDTCAECKAHLKKSDMITLLARSKRGEQPKQFGFMCRECFKTFCKNLGLDIPKLEELAESITIGSGDNDG
ncbi:DUF5131 family protein [Roseburia sp. 1XD42-69]|uniref:DUF5131 family protein n=1 Tax=Roseburia sp. 1XD42-69 TaxID=2320088 RepID=UPI000EA239AF|nr:DUF5131 family protein [Roseburia sp. 1XD42-69]RKJ64896.1 DUF5131 family protein [Roseburia sp. 1XD42-69]